MSHARRLSVRGKDIGAAPPVPRRTTVDRDRASPCAATRRRAARGRSTFSAGRLAANKPCKLDSSKRYITEGLLPAAKRAPQETTAARVESADNGERSRRVRPWPPRAVGYPAPSPNSCFKPVNRSWRARGERARGVQARLLRHRNRLSVGVSDADNRSPPSVSSLSWAPETISRRRSSKQFLVGSGAAAQTPSAELLHPDHTQIPERRSVLGLRLISRPPPLEVLGMTLRNPQCTANHQKTPSGSAKHVPRSSIVMLVVFRQDSCWNGREMLRSTQASSLAEQTPTMRSGATRTQRFSGWRHPFKRDVVRLDRTCLNHDGWLPTTRLSHFKLKSEKTNSRCSRIFAAPHCSSMSL